MCYNYIIIAKPPFTKPPFVNSRIRGNRCLTLVTVLAIVIVMVIAIVIVRVSGETTCLTLLA